VFFAAVAILFAGLVALSMPIVFALGVSGLLGLVLGDPMVPVAVDPRRRRFAEVIRARAAARAAATAPTRPATTHALPA